MIRFEGTEQFPQTPEAVAGLLSDAGRLARLMPDSEVVTADADRAVWTTRPKLAVLSGVLETSAAVTAREAGAAVRYRAVARASAGGSTIDAALAFRPADGGTAVAWSAEISELTGLLKLAPRPLLQSAGQKVIADVWAAVRAALSSERT